jgi:hypothetical protein
MTCALIFYDTRIPEEYRMQYAINCSTVKANNDVTAFKIACEILISKFNFEPFPYMVSDLSKQQQNLAMPLHDEIKWFISNNRAIFRQTTRPSIMEVIIGSDGIPKQFRKFRSKTYIKNKYLKTSGYLKAEKFEPLMINGQRVESKTILYIPSTTSPPEKF